MQRTKTVDEYIAAHQDWTKQLNQLRQLLNAAGLDETIKWGAPTYCLDNKNVIGLIAVKDYVGLWFFQGVFLSDPAKQLVNAQEGKTKAMRQWRFSAGQTLDEKLISKYINEAIENQKAGKIVAKDVSKPLSIPELLAAALEADEDLQAQFADMSLSKKREYAEHIASAKREATQQSRLEKAIPLIRAGVGLNDKYRK